MAPPDPYRDETRAARNRIAMLEEKLEGRGPLDEDDREIARLLAAKRSSKISANPAVAAGRALTFPLGILLTLTLTLAVCGSCNSEPFVGTVSHSKYFEYHDEVDEPLCPTLLSRLDEHAERIGRTIGAAPDPANPIRFYKFRDSASFESSHPCGPWQFRGCAFEDELFSAGYFSAHEQSHVHVHRAWGGYAVGLLEEGIAVSLSCDPLGAGDPTGWAAGQDGPLDWRDLLYLNGDSAAGYTAAGYWVTYLVKQYGWQRVAELWRRAPLAIAPADFERAFVEVFPTSMDQAWFDALHAPDAAPCQLSELCSGPAMVPGEPVTVGCDGKFPRTLVVTDQPGVVLSVRETGLPLTLANCENIKSPWFEVPSGLAVDGESRGATLWASLPTGTYATLSGLVNPTGEVTLESILSRQLLGSTCEEAGSVSLDPSGQTYIDLGEGAVDGWIHLSGGGRRYLVLPYNLSWSDASSLAGAPLLCDDCSATATCVSLAHNQSASLAISDHAVVRFQHVDSSSALGEWGRMFFLPEPAPDAGP